MHSTLAFAPFNQYAALGVLVLMGILFAGFNIFASAIMGPRRKGKVKGTVYESGVNPIGSARRRFNVRFFIVAMTFLLFDVEIVFLYPCASTFSSLAPEQSGYLEPIFIGRVLFFIFTSVVAFVYAWR